MCVQHKWPSANINNRRGKYTVRSVFVSSSLCLTDRVERTRSPRHFHRFLSSTSSLYSRPALVSIPSLSLTVCLRVSSGNIRVRVVCSTCIVRRALYLPVEYILRERYAREPEWRPPSRRRRRTVMEPLSLDNFIIGHWRRRFGIFLSFFFCFLLFFFFFADFFLVSSPPHCIRSVSVQLYLE